MEPFLPYFVNIHYSLGGGLERTLGKIDEKCNFLTIIDLMITTYKIGSDLLIYLTSEILRFAKVLAL